MLLCKQLLTFCAQILPVNIVSVAKILEERGLLDFIGGMAALYDLYAEGLRNFGF